MDQVDFEMPRLLDIPSQALHRDAPHCGLLPPWRPARQSPLILSQPSQDPSYPRDADLPQLRQQRLVDRRLPVPRQWLCHPHQVWLQPLRTDVVQRLVDQPQGIFYLWSVCAPPPAAVAGMGLALGPYDASGNALSLLIINVLGRDSLGSMLIFGLRGVRRRYPVLENEIRYTVVETLMASTVDLSTAATADVLLLSAATADVYAVVRNGTGDPLPRTLAEAAASEVASRTGYRSRALVEIILFQVNSTLKEGDFGPWATQWSRAGATRAICSHQEVC